MWDAEDAQSIGPPQSGALQVSVPLTSFHLPHRYALLLPSSKMWPMQRGAGSCPRSRGSWLIPSIAQRRWLSGRSTPRTSTIVGRKSDVIAVDHDSLFPLTTAGHEITPGTRCPVRTDHRWHSWKNAAQIPSDIVAAYPLPTCRAFVHEAARPIRDRGGSAPACRFLRARSHLRGRCCERTDTARVSRIADVLRS